MNGTSNIPAPRNEPVLTYAPGTPERAAIKAELKRLGGTVTKIPVIVHGEDIETGKTLRVVSPHRRSHHLADTHQADARALGAAVAAARRAQREWASWRFEDRAAVFLKAADLLAGPWRQRVNAVRTCWAPQSPTKHGRRSCPRCRQRTATPQSAECHCASPHTSTSPPRTSTCSATPWHAQWHRRRGALHPAPRFRILPTAPTGSAPIAAPMSSS